MKTLILFILAGLSCLASARLGETPQQLESRYGKATSSEPQTLHFRKNGIFVVAKMLDGKCQSLTLHPYKEAPDGKLSDGDPLTEKQIEALLSSNSQSSKWQGSRETGWKTPDGLLAAFAFSGGIVIETTAFSKAAIDKEKTEEVKKTEGF